LTRSSPLSGGGSANVPSMAATDIRILLHLYAERDWLRNLARLVSDRQAPEVMREIVRRLVVVEQTIAEAESTGKVPDPRKDSRE
jgi:hypothetical protein